MSTLLHFGQAEGGAEGGIGMAFQAALQSWPWCSGIGGAEEALDGGPWEDMPAPCLRVDGG